jgi:hypothetical protein
MLKSFVTFYHASKCHPCMTLEKAVDERSFTDLDTINV